MGKLQMHALKKVFCEPPSFSSDAIFFRKASLITLNICVPTYEQLKAVRQNSVGRSFSQNVTSVSVENFLKIFNYHTDS